MIIESGYIWIVFYSNTYPRVDRHADRGFYSGKRSDFRIFGKFPFHDVKFNGDNRCGEWKIFFLHHSHFNWFIPTLWSNFKLFSYTLVFYFLWFLKWSWNKIFTFSNFKMVHQKCRGENYSTTEVKRFQFPDDLIYYEVDYPEYQPTDFTGKYNQFKTSTNWPLFLTNEIKVNRNRLLQDKWTLLS